MITGYSPAPANLHPKSPSLAVLIQNSANIIYSTVIRKCHIILPYSVLTVFLAKNELNAVKGIAY